MECITTTQAIVKIVSLFVALILPQKMQYHLLDIIGLGAGKERQKWITKAGYVSVLED